MKNFTIYFFCTTLLLLSSKMLYGQTIPNSVLPNVGDVVQSIVGESEGLNEGQAGNGVVWDFTIMEPMPLMDPTVTTYISPSDTPFANEFPSANLAIAIETGSGKVYSYYKKENKEIYYLGGESLGTFIRSQQNPQLILDANLSGSQSTEDDFESTTESAQSTTYTKGVVNQKIDGSGTLKLPSGDYMNAVRVLSTTERIDSFGTDNLAVVSELNITSYYWFIPGQVDPVMTYNYSEGESTTTITGLPPTVTEIPQTVSIVYNPNPNSMVSSTKNTDWPEGIEISNISPNPTREFCSINLQLDQSEHIELSISNILGQNISNEYLNLSSGKQSHEFDLQGFQEGIYIVSIRVNNAVKSYKIKKLN